MEYNNSSSQAQKDSPVDIEKPYVSSTDACYPLGTVVPASMAYEQKRFAEKLKSSIKPSVHEFVMNRLNYTDYKEFCQSFGQEQIDAIANAIYNFENTGFGIIVADQTGVGKGRVGAGLIRYAIEYLKKMPIFVTDKKHLISDMYRDLIDIGYQANVPEQVKITSTEIEDITDNQIIKLIKKDIDDTDDLRIDISDIIDDAPEDFILEIKKLFGDKPENAFLPDGYEIEDMQDAIIQAYRLNLEINGLEKYIKDWSASEDGEFVSITKKGDTYDSLLKKELRAGKKLIKPFITFGYQVKDELGNIIYKVTYNKKTEQTQSLDKDLKVCMTTYSQLSTAFEKETKAPTPKFTLLRKIALNGILILDESHKATGTRKGEGGTMTNTAAAVADLIQLSKDTIFISATFAKRPENMFLYAMKTAIRESNLSNEDLIKIFKLGGNALQEASSAELARIGHIVRRQRPIVGKTFYEKVLPESTLGISQIESFDVFRQLSQSVRAYYGEVKGRYRTFLKDKLGDNYKELKDNYPHAGNVNLLTFNTVNQFLLGLKAEQTSVEAIQYLQDGKKPVIAIANTMESIFTNVKKDYINNIGYDIGDVIEDDLRLIFPYLWDYCFKYKEITYQMVPDENGVPEKKAVKKEYHLIHNCSSFFLGLRSEIYPLYESIMRSFVNANSIGTPLSPIDKIISNIQSRGFRVGEVTGRKRKLVYDSNGVAKLQTRKVANVTDTIRDFNFNVTDALVLNRSGAVGVSMHSKPNSAVNKFDKSILKIENLDDRPTPTSLEPRDEVKQRVMIITQMELDVNNEVQKLGRISRTGQIYAPIYKYLTSCVPFEARFSAMMEMKLRSLMATVSSDQEGASSMFTADDYLSDEGGDAVIQPAQSVGMKLPLDENGMLTKKGKDLVDYCLKQLYFKSVEDQTRFFNDFQKSLYEEIEKRKKDGTFNKKMSLKQYNAETVDVLPFELGMENPFSSFGAPVFAERLNIEYFEEKNFSMQIEISISKSLQTLGDSNGNKNAIDSLEKYQKYFQEIADANLLQNITPRHIEEKSKSEQKIKEALDEIESTRQQIEGYEKVQEAEEIYTEIYRLTDSIEKLTQEAKDLGFTNLMNPSPENQIKMNEIANQLQSEQSTLPVLKERFDTEFKSIYENRGKVSSALNKIASLESSIEKLNGTIENENEEYRRQVEMCERFKYYVMNIGRVFQYNARAESTDFITTESGDTIQEYNYAEVTNQPMVLTRVSYPFENRKNMNMTWGLIDLYLTPAYGGFTKENLSHIEQPLLQKEIEQKREQKVILKPLGYDYNDAKWSQLVSSSYTGIKGEKVFLTGSLLRAMAVANKNKLTGSIVKFNTIDNKIKIGFELTNASSQLILPKFNNTDSFPIVSKFSTSLVKDVILPYIIENLKADDNGYFPVNFNNYEILLFEVLEKTKSKIDDGASTIDDFLFVEFKNKRGIRSDVVYNLEEKGLDCQLVYVRISTNKFDYLYTILDFLNVLNIDQTDYEDISDGYARPLAYNSLTPKGDISKKTYTVPQNLREKIGKWHFDSRYNVPYYVANYLNKIYASNYNFSTATNAFVLTPALNYEIETKDAENWYEPKFAIDLTLNDFCKLTDYLNDLDLSIKTVVSYKMLKDSGKFNFDIESFQRASIVTDINGEGNLEGEMSDEVEQTIDGLIDNLVELFQ